MNVQGVGTLPYSLSNKKTASTQPVAVPANKDAVPVNQIKNVGQDSFKQAANYDLPSKTSNKAMGAYNDIANAQKKETLASMLGVDVYA